MISEPLFQTLSVLGKSVTNNILFQCHRFSGTKSHSERSLSKPPAHSTQKAIS